MGTYFHGNPAEIQQATSQEGLQTLVLMNPAYVQFSDTAPPQQSNNLLFFNSAANNLSPPPHLSHAPPNTQQFVGIPLDPNNSHDAAAASALHGLIPRLHYSFYNPVDPSSAARDTPRAQQGLSLSLNSQQQQLGFGSQAQPVSGEDIRISGGSVSSGSGVSNNGLSGVLLSSKYLKATQELLDEVVNVNDRGIGSELFKKGNGVSSNSNSKAGGELSAGDAPAGDGSATGKRGAELSTAERQEVQMKKAKLIHMLEEVEQRYRQYHHQMHIVMSTFEQAAGVGSAKTYTALALKTISKQFRCLKDAITGQIKAANKSLGEEDCLGGKAEGSSRLKFVDHHLRQQRAIQQLGMIQPNAWRPQRGLPERSVSVLRAWLFEHFLHPYPKDSDKHMLAKQTGLTRSQVSNWFINARVRLWKPMVEEMYLEELKEQEQNGSDDKTSKSEQNENSASKSILQEKNLANEIGAKSFKSLDSSASNVANAAAAAAMSISPAPPSPVGGGAARNQSVFSLLGSSELDGITQASPKKPRGNDMMLSPAGIPSINMDTKPTEATENDLISARFGNDRQNREGFSFMGGQNNFMGGFGQYTIGEIGRFDAEQFAPRFSGNSVSLTLGLPDCENLSLSGTHQGFIPNQNIQLGRRVEIGEANEFGAINTSTSSHSSSTAYETMDIQNRKRFTPAQLLPDFVA